MRTVQVIQREIAEEYMDYLVTVTAHRDQWRSTVRRMGHQPIAVRMARGFEMRLLRDSYEHAEQRA